MPTCTDIPDKSIAVSNSVILLGDSVDILIHFPTYPRYHVLLKEITSNVSFGYIPLDDNGCASYTFTPPDIRQYTIQGQLYDMYTNKVTINVISPTTPPVIPPTAPPNQPPNQPPSQPPTTPPSQPPTTPPNQPPTTPPVLKPGIVSSNTTRDGYLYWGECVKEVINIDFFKYFGVINPADIVKGVPQKIQQIAKSNNWKVLKTEIYYDNTGIVFDTIRLTIWHVPPPQHTKAMQIEIIPILEILAPYISEILAVIAAFLVATYVAHIATESWKGALFAGGIVAAVVVVVLASKDKSLKQVIG